MQPSRRLCKKSASSNRWLARQQSDPFVKARTSNSSITSTTHYRSRASHKLLGLVNRYPQLLPRGGTVVDLGCAPGGWAQVAAERVGKRGTVIGVDLLPVRELGEEYPNVNLIQGDFLTSTVHQQLVDLLPERRVSTPERDAEHTTSRKIKVDTVMSDMMANMTGVRIRDVENSLDLCRSALEFAIQFLRTDKPGGNLLLKHFAHPDFSRFKKDELESRFRIVHYVKPEASRSESSEGFFVCLGFGSKRT